MRYFPPKTGRTWRGRPNGGSTRAWRNQRERILARDGYRCTHVAHDQRCPVSAPARLETHHLNPGHGPAAEDHELVTSCPAHNPRGSYA